MLELATPLLADTPLPQTIQLSPVPDQTLNALPFQVIALASSGLPVSVAVSGPATIFHRQITLTGTGTVTITATQAGNGTYAAASAQETFQVNGAPPTLHWSPGTLTYGMPVTSDMLNATATAVAVVDAQADVSTVTSQLNVSKLTGGTTPTVSQFSPLIRYEGSTMGAPIDPNAEGGLQATGAAPPLGLDYRVVFTCDCQQFEWIMESRQSDWRLWVDGQWATVNEIEPEDDYFDKAFYLVQFPDKRPRQIKIYLSGNPPFDGLITTGNDTISAPQVPVGKRVIFMGDSWTGPTFSPPLLPPAQDGLSGSGFAQVTGEYFNWDYWISSVGGEGFAVVGSFEDVNFGQRALTDICGQAPDAVVVVGGTNDGGVTADQVQQAAQTLVSNVQGCLPGVPIYIFGPQAVNTIASQGLSAAFLQQPVANVYYVDMSPSADANDPQNWIYGSFNDSTIGNAYLYIGTNNGAEGHPTPLGHDYVAERIEDALTRQFPTLAPSAYTLFNPTPLAGATTYSVQPGSLLPAGSDTVTATFTPQDTVHYATATQGFPVVVAQATTSVAVTATQPNGASSVTLSVAVKPQFGGTPTGTLLVSDGSTQLGSVPLVNGSAAYTAQSLTTGTHALTAVYSGDSNFTGSQAATSVQIVQPPPDFAFTLTPPTTVLQAGSSTGIPVAFTPVNGFTGAITASCTGLPSGATCALMGSPVQISGGAQTLTLVLTAPAASAAQGDSSLPWPLRHTGASSSVLLGAAALWKVRRSRYAACLLLGVVALSGAVILTGCGSSIGVTGTPAPTPAPAPVSPPAAVSYNVQVTLAAQAAPAIAHTQTLQVSIN